MKKFTLVCLNNGCMFLKGPLGKREAEREATSHMNVYQHNVAMNPAETK